MSQLVQHGEHAARRGREHEEDRGHEERESTWSIEKCRGRRHAAAAAHSRLVSDIARREIFSMVLCFFQFIACFFYRSLFEFFPQIIFCFLA